MLFMSKTSVDSEGKKEKKCQHILSQIPLVTAFVTPLQKTRGFFFFFLFNPPSRSLPSSLPPPHPPPPPAAFATPTGQDC